VLTSFVERRSIELEKHDLAWLALILEGMEADLGPKSLSRKKKKGGMGILRWKKGGLE